MQRPCGSIDARSLLPQQSDRRVGDHAPVLGTQPRLGQVDVEDLSEGVTICDTEKTKSADEHVNIQGIEIVAKHPLGLPTAEDAPIRSITRILMRLMESELARCSARWMFSIATRRTKSA